MRDFTEILFKVTKNLQLININKLVAFAYVKSLT